MLICCLSPFSWACRARLQEGRNDFADEQSKIAGGRNDFADEQNKIAEGRNDFVDSQNVFSHEKLRNTEICDFLGKWFACYIAPHTPLPNILRNKGFLESSPKSGKSWSKKSFPTLSCP